MANVFFNLKVTWPTVTNDIRVSVYNASDLNTPIATQQQNAPHLDQQFSFPGLPRVNFVYKIQEYSIDGDTFISNLGQANFVPANDEMMYKPSVLIEVGASVIPGTEASIWPDGTNTVNVPDWIGWELQASGRNGQYPWRRDINTQIDITWDPLTGDLTLNNIDDVFQPGEFLYFEFDPIINESSGGVSTGGGGNGWSEILVVTTDTTLNASDIGKKILIIPSGNYLEITLPDYTDIEANKITWFEMDANATQKCALVKTFSGQNITWLEVSSNLYICNNESFELYKRVVSAGVYQWRIQNAVGNFLTAGDFFWSDLTTDKIFNATLADGGNRDYQQYARLYNRHIVRNGGGLAYASWSSANLYTRVKFSLKETSGNNFRVPDFITTPMYMRAGNSTDFFPMKLLQHQHMQSIGDLPVPTFGQTPSGQTMVTGEYGGTGNNRLDLTSRSTSFNSATGLYEIIDGTENNPNSRISRLYIKV